MKRLLLSLCFGLGLGLGANAARAQDETHFGGPNFAIGYIEQHESQSIGGSRMQLETLKFTDLNILGAWTFEDKAGLHAYIFVDDAQEAKWENTDLVMAIGLKLFDVNRMQRWKTGETALILDDVDDESAAALRQANFRAPLAEQLEVKWQSLDNGKVRLTVSNVGSQTLQLALHNALYVVTATRDDKSINASVAPLSVDEAPNFEPLQPGAIWQRDLTLGSPLEFSPAGHYKIEIETQFPIRDGGTPKDPASIIVKFPATLEFDGPAK